MVIDEDENSPMRQYCFILRTLALYLFQRWKKECPAHYQMFKCDLIASGNELPDNFANQSLSVHKKTHS